MKERALARQAEPAAEVHRLSRRAQPQQPRSSDEYAHSGNFAWPAEETCELMVEQALGAVAAVAVEREAALQWQLDGRDPGTAEPKVADSDDE